MKNLMRGLASALLVALSAMAAAQTPPAKTASSPPAKPAGSLAQIMRGVYFPSSNLIYDVQQHDPGARGGILRQAVRTDVASEVHRYRKTLRKGISQNQSSPSRCGRENSRMVHLVQDWRSILNATPLVIATRSVSGTTLIIESG